MYVILILFNGKIEKKTGFFKHLTRATAVKEISLQKF